MNLLHFRLDTNFISVSLLRHGIGIFCGLDNDDKFTVYVNFFWQRGERFNCYSITFI